MLLGERRRGSSHLDMAAFFSSIVQQRPRLIIAILFRAIATGNYCPFNWRSAQMSVFDSSPIQLFVRCTIESNNPLKIKSEPTILFCKCTFSLFSRKFFKLVAKCVYNNKESPSSVRNVIAKMTTWGRKGWSAFINNGNNAAKKMIALGFA